MGLATRFRGEAVDSGGAASNTPSWIRARHGRPGKEVGATATHYDILGVAPDASHDEVKRAFTDLALKWHPDRQAEPGPDTRERAEWRMAEINAAWDVLRNPASRAAYDEQLAAGSQAPARVRARRAAGEGTPRPVSFADQLVDPAQGGPADARSSRRRLGRWAPVLVIAGLLAVIAGLAINASRRSTTPPPPGVQIQTEQFQVGACVVVLAGPNAVQVPCDEPNSGHISATTDYPRPCPAGTTTVALVSRQISLCLAPP